uniref:Uncharacterized protein n=1 Tax=Arundo donax TaxID=35708 RepID=A0A0A9B0K9_ARUDO
MLYLLTSWNINTSSTLHY